MAESSNSINSGRQSPIFLKFCEAIVKVEFDDDPLKCLNIDNTVYGPYVNFRGLTYRFNSTYNPSTHTYDSQFLFWRDIQQLAANACFTVDYHKPYLEHYVPTSSKNGPYKIYVMKKRSAIPEKHKTFLHNLYNNKTLKTAAENVYFNKYWQNTEAPLIANKNLAITYAAFYFWSPGKTKQAVANTITNLIGSSDTIKTLSALIKNGAKAITSTDEILYKFIQYVANSNIGKSRWSNLASFLGIKIK